MLFQCQTTTKSCNPRPGPSTMFVPPGTSVLLLEPCPRAATDLVPTVDIGVDATSSSRLGDQSTERSDGHRYERSDRTLLEGCKRPSMPKHAAPFCIWASKHVQTCVGTTAVHGTHFVQPHPIGRRGPQALPPTGHHQAQWSESVQSPSIESLHMSHVHPVIYFVMMALF